MHRYRTWVGAGLLLAVGAGPARGQTAGPADTTRPAAPPHRYTEQLLVFPPQAAADSTRSTMARVVHFLNQDLHFPP